MTGQQAAPPTIRIPDSLAELDQWIVWRYERRDGGKPTKVPYQINGSHASSTDAKTWCSWDEALESWRENPNRWSGIGFVFSPGDPYFGIDLDDCIDAAGQLKPWAQPIMERYFDSYAEISPSGRGIKIWGKGSLPGGGAAFPLGDGRVEIYDQARYFTVTGNHWAGQMLDVEEHQAALEWLLALSPHGQKKVPFTLDEGKIPKGSQHDTLVSIAGTMRARGCEYPEIEAALLEINRGRLEENAPEQNIKRIAASVCAYPPGEKRRISGADQGMADNVEVGPPEPAKWPAPIDDAAYYGLAGDIVRTLEPQTEADPVALLIHVLVGVGNLGGRSPYFQVGGASHHTNENAICVGKTSSARKGTAKSDTFNLLRHVDPAWVENHVLAGLSSGEGLIWAVRDEIEKQEPIRDKKKTITGYQTVIVDMGVADKRLLVIEPEFASVLRVAGRDGNTLSTVYRQAWDSGLLRVLNKNSPVKATGAHISIIGHITRDELLMELSNNDKVNGFGNRNLWLCVQRSKFLPDGGDWDHLDLDPLISRLTEVVEFAHGLGEMRRDAEAGAMWREVYPQLSGERAGLFGALTSRAEAHVLRLSCIYALLDMSTEVRRCHLEAALALWKYCEDSAEFIFGAALGNQVADRILKALGGAPEGLTRSDLRDLFGGHRSSEEIGTALRILGERALVECEKEDTGGRPVERWFAASEDARKARKARKGV
ncbi:MAG: primase C-terminal domain-containing protein [Acidobacteriia bacterium]|nr:primase C-terminal domain-containing protein [Terriglobia bacterium]